MSAVLRIGDDQKHLDKIIERLKKALSLWADMVAKGDKIGENEAAKLIKDIHKEHNFYKLEYGL